jgi:hypothetical protein
MMFVLSALRACRPLPPGIFLVLIYIIRWVDPKGILGLESLRQLKISLTLLRIEPATFGLAE